MTTLLVILMIYLAVFSYAAVACFTTGIVVRFDDKQDSVPARIFGVAWPLTWVIVVLVVPSYFLVLGCYWIYQKEAGEI